MLHYAVTFFIIALVAAILGFGGIAGSAIEIAKILFFVFFRCLPLFRNISEMICIYLNALLVLLWQLMVC